MIRIYPKKRTNKEDNIYKKLLVQLKSIVGVVKDQIMSLFKTRIIVNQNVSRSGYRSVYRRGKKPSK